MVRTTRTSPAATSRRKHTAPQLSPDDWADAGLHVLAQRGWADLTIDVVADRLRVTKGSFYWHFPDKNAYVRAVLARWLHVSAAHTFAQVASIREPRARLQRIFQIVFDEAGPIELDSAIFAARAEPLVAAAIDRAARERIDLLATVYQELGLAPASARRWALSAYSVFVGLVSTGESTRYLLRAPAERTAYAEHVMALLTPPRSAR